MERNEMIEIIIEKTKVSREEAIEALEKCNWDIVDTIIHLERNGKVENNEITTIIEIKEEEQQQDKKESDKKCEDMCGGIGKIIGRIFKFIGKLIRKGNENFFEIKKENEKPLRVSLTISALLLIFLSAPTVILLVAGLFCGYKYSLAGNVNYHGVNDAFEKVSESADTIKNNFKEGYGK